MTETGGLQYRRDLLTIDIFQLEAAAEIVTDNNISDKEGDEN